MTTPAPSRMITFGISDTVDHFAAHKEGHGRSRQFRSVAAFPHDLVFRPNYPNDTAREAQRTVRSWLRQLVAGLTGATGGTFEAQFEYDVLVVRCEWIDGEGGKACAMFVVRAAELIPAHPADVFDMEADEVLALLKVRIMHRLRAFVATM